MVGVWRHFGIHSLCSVPSFALLQVFKAYQAKPGIRLLPSSHRLVVYEQRYEWDYAWNHTSYYLHDDRYE
jgi:hypothetical protein